MEQGGREATVEGSARRAWLAALAVVAVILVWQYRDGIVFGRYWLGGDNAFQNFPWHVWAHEAKAAGRLFAPVPEMTMGLPLWVEPQSGVWYPLNTALWPALDPWFSFTLKIVLHYGLAAAGMCWLAARLGCSPTAAAAAAIVFSCGSFAVYQIPRIPAWQVVAWYPWIALCVAEGLRADGRRLWLVVAAGLQALQLLGGQPQFMLPTPLLCLGIGLLVQPREKPWPARLATAGGVVAAILAAALMMSAVMWLPASGAVAAGPRLGDTTVEWLTMWGCSFGEAMQSWLGGLSVAYKMEKASFSSTAALVAIALAWGRGDRWRRWWLLVAVLGLWVSWSVGNPLAYLLVELPVLNRFRNPSRYDVLYAFAASFLVALLVDDAGRIDPRRWRQACAVAMAMLVAALAVVKLAPDVTFPAGLWVQFAALALLYAAAGRPPRLARGLVVAAVGGELLWFGSGVNDALTRAEWAAREDSQVYEAAASEVAQYGGYFVAWMDRLPDNRSLLYHVPQATSHTGLPYPGNQEVQLLLHGNVRPEVLAAYDITVVCAREETGLKYGLLPLRRVGDWWLFRNPIPPVGAYLPKYLIPASLESVQQSLFSADAVPRSALAVTENLWPPGYQPGVGGQVLSQQQTLDGAVVRTRSESGCLLVLTRAWALGWRAFVDGQPVPTGRANFTLLCAPVPPGEHEVTFRYEVDLALEQSLSNRAWLLWLVGLVAAAVVDRRRRRNSR